MASPHKVWWLPHTQFDGFSTQFDGFSTHSSMTSPHTVWWLFHTQLDGFSTYVWLIHIRLASPHTFGFSTSFRWFRSRVREIVAWLFCDDVLMFCFVMWSCYDKCVKLLRFIRFIFCDDNKAACNDRKSTRKMVPGSRYLNPGLGLDRDLSTI